MFLVVALFRRILILKQLMNVVFGSSVVLAKVGIQRFFLNKSTTNCHCFWIPDLAGITVRIVITLALFCSFTASANDGKLDQMIQELLRDKLSDDAVMIEVTMESRSKLEELRLKEDSIDNIQLTYFSPAASSFRIKVRMMDGAMQEMSGRYTPYVELPVAIKQIRAGDIISATDVTTTKTRLSHIKSNYVNSTDTLVGMQARKTLQAGAPVKQNDITLPHVVHDGDVVSLVYQNSHLKLKTLGTVVGSGAIGDTIKAKNNTTGILVYGKVISKNVIEVSVE